MLRYRAMLAGAIVMALISAGSLGTGLVGLGPVLENILGRGRTLAELLEPLNARLGGPIPPETIATLPPGRFTAVVVIVAGLGVLTVIGGTANFLHAYLTMTVVQRAVANIRREIFHRVLRLPLMDVIAGSTADKVSRLVGDAAALESGFNALLSRTVAQVTKGLAAFLAALIVEWRLTVAAALAAPLLYGVIRNLGKRVRRASRRAMQSQAGLYAAALEALQGLRVVKVHTTERYEAGRFHRINKDVMRQMLRVRAARALAGPLVEGLTVLAVGALCLIAAKVVIDGQLDPGRFLVALAALGFVGAALKPLTGLLNDISASAAAAQRLRELFEARPEPGHDLALPRLPRHVRSLEFHEATVFYPGSTRPALAGVSLRIAHGERVAFVGPNGAGKTTLLSLVPRLFDPQRGAVLIDGRDIRQFSVRSLRRQIGVVTQETVLFRASVRDNIAYGAEDASPQRIEAAARKARAHEFIVTLPRGYDTILGEQGLTLSGGQRQRLAIARAILRDPAILILDEATSMVDADSEAKIAEAIAEFSLGRTCLIVAHRLSTVLHADRIVVMDQGRIVDEGTHAALLVRCPVYRLIAENQLLRDDRPMVESGVPALANTPTARSRR